MLSKKHFCCDVSHVFHNEDWKRVPCRRILTLKWQPRKMKEQFNSNWTSALASVGVEIDWKRLEATLRLERLSHRCFPSEGNELKAFNGLAPAEVKVVICGQDPYHGLDQADGLAFSVKQGVDWPPSLRNIVREYESDLDRAWPVDGLTNGQGVLAHWAAQGVLLMNDVLTVREGEPGSHHDLGWQELTTGLFKALCELENPLVFVLWGKEAQKKAVFVHRSNHLVLESPHPSPLSAYRGFWGSKPFSRSNDWLALQGQSPIEW